MCIRMLLLATVLQLLHGIGAFTVPHTTTSMTTMTCQSTKRIHNIPLTALEMGIFDDIQSFFSGDSSNANNNEGGDSSGGAYLDPENRLATIPVKAMKPGGLRLFLMFYLLGMQNTPDPGAWKADQPTRDEYMIDCYYHDRSAMLSIELSDEHNVITIDRIGAHPSNAYMMQETVIVEGVLDELQQLALDDQIEEENRLLQLKEPKAIETARQELSFG